jgi:GTP-binding protein EngB required for normal cell division
MADTASAADFGPPRHPLAAAVATLAEDLAKEAAASDNDVAERLRRHAVAGPSGAATVVVVGEKKRGKSSLINALIERPGLLPVDVDVASCVHLVVGYAAEETAQVVDVANPDGRPVPLTDIGRYAALDPETGLVRHPDVSHVTVGLPHPVLTGLNLIDTPGVGGLVAGHASITSAAVQRADALLFVVNGASELTSSECEFLAGVSDQTSTVLFVLTQIDKYPQWQQILDTNRRLIAEHAPTHRDAPWFAVSSRLRDEATRAGDPDLAARWLARSNFEALIDAIRTRVVERVRTVRLDNTVRDCARVAEDLLGQAELRLRSIRRDPALAVAVSTERDRLNALTAQSAAWRATLRTGFKTIDEELTLHFHRGLNDLSAATARRIGDVTADASMIDEVPAQLMTGAQALWADVDRELHRRIQTLVADVARDLPAGDAVGGGLSLPERIRTMPELERPHPHSAGLAGGVEHGLGATGAGMLVFGLVGGLIAPIAGVAAGLGAGYFLQKRRRLREQLAHDRAAANRYLQVVVGEMKTEFPAALKAALRGTHDRLADLFAAQLTARQAELDAAITQAERSARIADAEVDDAKADARRHVDDLTELVRRATQLAADLRG